MMKDDAHKQAVMALLMLGDDFSLVDARGVLAPLGVDEFNMTSAGYMHRTSQTVVRGQGPSIKYTYGHSVTAKGKGLLE